MAAPRKKITEKEQAKGLAANSIVSSERGVDYLVERMLGQGGFGEVWKVSLYHEPDKRFAMKIEPNNHEKKNMLRLKCEVSLFEEIERSEKIDKTHFVKMHDRGKTVLFKYYIMDLIWLSLREVKKKICGDVFTPSTTIKVARQSLKAIEALHELGFLHRDIKPHNYAVGLPPKDSVLYLLDFGICRAYKEKDGVIKRPRKEVKFMGTMLYASMESLAKREQSRRDDLEMWLWMMLEIYDRNNLLWIKVENDERWEHIEKRQELMLNSRDLRKEGRLKCPEPWCDIIDMINEMDFDTPPDYPGINDLFSLMCIDGGINESQPFDWAGKAPNLSERPKRKDRKKKPDAKGDVKEAAAVDKKKSKNEVKEDEGKDPKPRLKPKKTVEDHDSGKEVEGKDPKPRHRPKRTEEDHDSRSDSDTDTESDYEAYLRWKKKKRDKKKHKHRDYGSREDDGLPVARKKTSKEKITEKKGKESKCSKQSKQEAEPKESRKEEEKKETRKQSSKQEAEPKESRKEEEKKEVRKQTSKQEAEPKEIRKEEDKAAARKQGSKQEAEPKASRKEEEVKEAKIPEVKPKVGQELKHKKFVNRPTPAAHRPAAKPRKRRSLSPSQKSSDSSNNVKKRFGARKRTTEEGKGSTQESVEHKVVPVYLKKKAALAKEPDKKLDPKKTAKSIEETSKNNEVKKLPDEKPAEKPVKAVASKK